MANPYFNAVYYLQQNPDVFSAGYTVATAWDHYVNHGANEANITGGTFRAPNPWFDVKYYLANNPDLVRAGITPATALDHFLTYGSTAGEDRAPNATIAAAPITEAKLLAYAKANADLQKAFGISATATTLTAAEQTSLLNHFYAYGYNETRADKPAVVVTPDANEGKTFTLTTAIDVVNGTTGNDNIIGDNSVGAATVQAGDQVDGGAGTDTFNYYGSNATDVVIPQMKNVEVLNLYGTNVQGLTTTNVAGLEQVNLVNVAAAAATGAGAIGINLAGTQSLGLNNVTGGQALTASFGATATAATLNLSNGSNVGAVNLNGAALKTLNIDSTGKANTVAALISTGSENKVVFTGDQKATVTAALADTVKTVDASASTGGVSVTAGNTDVTFTGGAGNDTIKFAAGQFTTLDVVDGGAGSDTLSLADTAAPSSSALLKAINAAKNFETIAFSGGGATLDAALITNGATSYQVDTMAGNFALTNVTSAGTVTYLAVDNSTQADSIANKLGDLNANVTLTANSTSAAKTGVMTLTGINTVNLKSDFTGTGSQATANAFGTATAGNTDNTKFLITGTQDLVLAKLNGTTTGSTVDASAFTGKLTATGSGKADSLTGGSGADKLAGGDITGNTVGTKEAATIAFTAVGNNAADTYDITVGTTMVTAAHGASISASVTNIVAALTGNATINGLVDVVGDTLAGTVVITWKTAGNKTDVAFSETGTNTGTGSTFTNVTVDGTNISAGAGTAAADILAGGAGADTFVFNGLQDSAYAADASTVDTITDFTAASDKLDVSGIVYNVVNSATAASSFGSYQAADLVAQSTVQASVNAASPSTLAAAVTAAATQISADKVGAFQYNGDTYVFLNDNNAAVTAADGLIKLSGAVELAATDFVFAA